MRRGTPYPGLDHFGLSVSGIDAVAAILKKKASSSPRTDSPRRGIKICFIRGPQGVSIELARRDPKYT